MDWDRINFVRQGWQCPVCRRVYSPDTPMCYSCSNYETITTTTLNVGTKKKSLLDSQLDWLNEYLDEYFKGDNNEKPL